MTFSCTGVRPPVDDELPDGEDGERPPQAQAVATEAASITAELRLRTPESQQRNCRVSRTDTDEPARRLQCPRVVPDSARSLDASVLICTYNRETLLGETLDSLARCRVDGLRWDVLVVDNNSTDRTREIVTARIGSFPVPLRYLFEPRQGKSNALNTGLAATDAAVVAFTDDDVQFDENWVEQSCRPLVSAAAIDYTGGPVLPIWASPCPPWLDQTRADLWGTLAILDYGREPFLFEERRRVPLGANMAVRRSLIDRIGGFHPDLGRRGNSLLGQEQAEFFCRSRASGARGLYVPEMALRHHVPARRLTRSYFRRWWYWKGISKSRLEQRHPVTEMGVDLSRVRKLLGVPRFMIGSAVRDLMGWAAALLTWKTTDRMRHEMMLCYFAGYVVGIRQIERESRRAFYSPATDKR
jgi:glycosyltransferase involved in cell wall biosynthesis